MYVCMYVYMYTHKHIWFDTVTENIIKASYDSIVEHDTIVTQDSTLHLTL